MVKKTAFLFPGQGSQAVGMGQGPIPGMALSAIFSTWPRRSPASAIARLCFEGPMEDLTQTVNLQPAVTAVNLACLAAIARPASPRHCAGHSLGEYSALCAAGVVSPGTPCGWCSGAAS